MKHTYAGKYCVTHEAVIEKLGSSHKNLRIWRTSDGDNVASFHKKGITNDTWPAIQFDAAENYLFFTVKDAVVLYDMSTDMTKAARKVKMEGVSQFMMGPGKRKVFASFVPESAKPAVFAINEWEEGGTVINRKQFYRVRYSGAGMSLTLSTLWSIAHTITRFMCILRCTCVGFTPACWLPCGMRFCMRPCVRRQRWIAVQATRGRLHWNAKGTHVVCQSISDFDATNQSYFGESRLYMLSADGKVDTAITMDNDTNIVDVAWSPGGNDFVAIGGHQPATAVLFDLKGKPLCNIGKGPFNTIRWNPFGRFLLLAGFGSLPGDVRLFERKDNKVETMGSTRSECSVEVCFLKRTFAGTSRSAPAPMPALFSVSDSVTLPSAPAMLLAFRSARAHTTTSPDCGSTVYATIDQKTF